MTARMTTDPFPLFDAWLAEARVSEPNDGNAMALATATPDGRPSVRMVLLKGHGPDGFIFYTNLDSRKGGELAANPQVALLFHWKSLRRQIRIEGRVAPVEDSVADAYFATRSRDSQLGAWASNQSSVVENRAALEKQRQEVAARFPQAVPLPPNWGGFALSPTRIEFWQGRPSRLHDRFAYSKQGDGSWRLDRLSP